MTDIYCAYCKHLIPDGMRHTDVTASNRFWSCIHAHYPGDCPPPDLWDQTKPCEHCDGEGSFRAEMELRWVCRKCGEQEGV